MRKELKDVRLLTSLGVGGGALRVHSLGRLPTNCLHSRSSVSTPPSNAIGSTLRQSIPLCINEIDYDL